MTKNLGRDFTYGHETPRQAVGKSRNLLGTAFGLLFPLVARSLALLIGSYFFG